MQSQEFRYGQRYEYSFFKGLVRLACKRCGISYQNGQELLYTARAVTQYEMWSAIQEMLEWMESQGRPFMFSRRAFYYGTSQRVPLDDFFADLMEISALWTGHRYGIYARELGRFPEMKNEKGIARAILQGFFARLFEGYNFGPAFASREPETPLAVWLDILYGRDHEVACEGWKTVRDKITLQAMSILVADFLTLFSMDKFRQACLFLKKRIAENKTRINTEHARRWIGEFYLAEVTNVAMVH